jgi:4-hydroxy-tetrahydrodipicolinate synthase
VLLYNLPARTHVSILLHTLGRLARLENIVGIKDSSGDLSITIDYIRHTPDDFSVMNGNDGLIVPAMIAGARGR